MMTEYCRLCMGHDYLKLIQGPVESALRGEFGIVLRDTPALSRLICKECSNSALRLTDFKKHVRTVQNKLKTAEKKKRKLIESINRQGKDVNLDSLAAATLIERMNEKMTYHNESSTSDKRINQPRSTPRPATKKVMKSPVAKEKPGLTPSSATKKIESPVAKIEQGSVPSSKTKKEIESPHVKVEPGSTPSSATKTKNHPGATPSPTSTKIIECVAKDKPGLTPSSATKTKNQPESTPSPTSTKIIESPFAKDKPALTPSSATKEIESPVAKIKQESTPSSATKAKIQSPDAKVEPGSSPSSATKRKPDSTSPDSKRLRTNINDHTPNESFANDSSLKDIDTTEPSLQIDTSYETEELNTTSTQPNQNLSKVCVGCYGQHLRSPFNLSFEFNSTAELLEHNRKSHSATQQNDNQFNIVSQLSCDESVEFQKAEKKSDVPLISNVKGEPMEDVPIYVKDEPNDDIAMISSVKDEHEEKLAEIPAEINIQTYNSVMRSLKLPIRYPPISSKKKKAKKQNVTWREALYDTPPLPKVKQPPIPLQLNINGKLVKPRYAHIYLSCITHWKCRLCQTICNTVTELETHYDECLVRRTCRTCLSIFTSFEDVTLHKIIAHSNKNISIESYHDQIKRIMNTED